MPYKITLIINSHPGCYHRDLQVLEKGSFSAIQNLTACLDIAIFVIKDVEIKGYILENKKYDYLSTVNFFNEMVVAEMLFRDAYKAVA